MSFGERVQTWDFHPMPNFVKKKSLKGIGSLGAKFYKKFEIVFIFEKSSGAA